MLYEVITFLHFAIKGTGNDNYGNHKKCSERNLRRYARLRVTSYNVCYTKLLREVVAIGYGTMKKSDLTGSVSSISSEALESKTIASVDQALQGMASGVMASSTSGEPGGGMNIRIRGVSSYTNASEPLYVIDGIPIIINSDYSLSGDFQTSNPLASLNPADIQSVEILKDASATSIYGSRGSNGVILITTKKGKGAPRIRITSYNVCYTKLLRLDKLVLFNL